MSVWYNFPNPRRAMIENDIICIGGEITPESVEQAYDLGIFPWPHEGYPLFWFCPDQRGIIDFKDLHISRSLKKWIKKNQNEVRVTVNQSFYEVIINCQNQKRQNQSGTWITSEIVRAYTKLSEKNKTIAIECWRGDALVGGIYGVMSKKYFSCESMFFKESNMSKYAFIQLVEYLSGLGHHWMDLQMVTDVSASFGGAYISRIEFLDRIQCT